MKLSANFSLDELIKSDTAIRKVIELDLSYAKAYNELGFLLEKLKRFDEAEKNYRKAIEIDPSSASFLNLAVMLRNLKRYDEAEITNLQQQNKIISEINRFIYDKIIQWWPE